MNKKQLDTILVLHKAQPVGHGYIDVIVSRENYGLFITDLIDNRFVIKSISWWEWCPAEQECNYGLGGPKSDYYDGWYAELPVDIDEIDNSRDMTTTDIVEKIKNLIDTKIVRYPNEIVTFKQSYWLTPGIWLDVPSDWRNTL